jgi:hypothetical protein
MNRDESHARPESWPPQIIQTNPNKNAPSAVYPIDPPAGTWCGANSSGLIAALLNRNPGTAPAFHRAAGIRSRGVIIPLLLQYTAAAKALNQLTVEKLEKFAPFTLIASDEHGLHECTWGEDGWHHISHDFSACHLAQHSAPQARCWTSSGYGDAWVAEARSPIFQEHFLNKPSQQRQDALHHRRDGNDGARWIWMRREDARTVSRTTFDIHKDRVCCHYTAFDAVDRPSDAADIILTRNEHHNHQRNAAATKAG